MNKGGDIQEGEREVEEREKDREKKEKEGTKRKEWDKGRRKEERKRRIRKMEGNGGGNAGRQPAEETPSGSTGVSSIRKSRLMKKLCFVLLCRLLALN